MVCVGINGLGRIGKCLFLQLIKHKYISVSAINIPNFHISNLEFYLRNDSNHKHNIDFTFKIIDKNTFMIDDRIIKMLSDRDPSKLNWKLYNIEYVIDSTGVFLTKDSVKNHNVPYIIMCAPPKDSTPQFLYNGNHLMYKGEDIVSNASCTTNCIVPVLKFINDNYGILKANFTTIHSATASQNTNDTTHLKSRTSRSIFNNIIPHTTGASKSISKILPEMKDIIAGTSLRVPTSNVSIVDLNVKLKKNISFENLMEDLKGCNYIYFEDSKFKVSSDYNTTTCPSIVDSNACMDLGDNEFKLMIWYDNEWSYSAQVIKLLEYMYVFNCSKLNNLRNIEAVNFENKKVILRLDWNVPILDSKIQDFFRVESSLDTIKYILSQNPKYICIISHLGRPKGIDENLSWNKYLDQINNKLNDIIPKINLLDKGLSEDTIDILNKNEHKIYLLENIRFHPEETKITEKSLQFKTIFNNLGDVYVNDAFGCSHRDHLSITGFNNINNSTHGLLIRKEIENLDIIVNNIYGNKILAIIGGGKMDDKLPLLKNLSKKIDGIYIAGGNINSILKNKKYSDFIEEIKINKSKIYLMEDGIASKKLDQMGTIKNCNDLSDNENFFDIGMESLIRLNNILNDYDIIFWNGTLGVVENDFYKKGSNCLLNMLVKSDKKIIIGGGDTASFVNKQNIKFNGYISTGGGASIEYLSNGSLIGIN